MVPVRSSRLRSWALLSALGLSVAGCTTAESRDAPGGEKEATRAPARPTVPTGTSMTFRVDETISTQRSHRGDRFTGTLTADVAGVEGDVVLPAGTKARWVVNQAISDGGLGGGSVLAVRLEAIRLNDAWVLAEGALTATDLQLDESDSTAGTAAKIGVGAAAGAIVGQLLGKDTQRAVTGVATGPALGTVVALSTRRGAATIPAGSRIEVRLDRSLILDG
jgi:hypothetical protein